MITIIFYLTGVVFCCTKLVQFIASVVRKGKDREEREYDDRRRYRDDREKFLETFRKRFDESDEEEQISIIRWLKGKKKGGEDTDE